MGNADEATENFDVITYEKGGAMLRMIEGYLGAAAFRDGIRAYIREHAYGNTVADDLWGALGRTSGQPIEEVANGPGGWLGRGGYPLIDVKREGNRVTIAQRQTLRGYSRTGGFLLRRATASRLDEALDGLERLV